MLTRVFSLFIRIISTCVGWLFTLQINDNPPITIGGFLLSCAFIGLVLYLVIGSNGSTNVHVSAPNVRGTVDRFNSRDKGGK